MQDEITKLSQLLRKSGIKVPQSGDVSILRAMVAELKRQHRLRLERLALAGAAPGRSRADKQRYVRSQIRRRFSLKQGKRVRPSKDVLMARYRSSYLLDTLFPSRKERWLPILKRDFTALPSLSVKSFSFIDNPEETLSALRRVVELDGTAARASLHFDDEYCMDVGAYLVLGEMWPALTGVYQGGRMNVPVQKALKAVGLGQHLNISLKGARNTSDVWAYPLQRRRPRNTSTSRNWLLEPQTRERVADGLCDAVNEWLDRPEIEQELTEEGRAWLTSIVGELLDNAERHSAPSTKDGDWATAAFMARRLVGEEHLYRCHVAFLSIGATIAESLDTAGPVTGRQLAAYLHQHRQSDVDPEVLKTLFAFQDGVTRDAEAEAAQRGGIGLQEVLHFINILGGTERPGCEPRMTVVSGNACLQLRSPYIQGQSRQPGGRRTMWCNEANSWQDPPDAGFAYRLSERFAGTIISMAFTLDPEYLRGTLDSDGPENESG